MKLRLWIILPLIIFLYILLSYYVGWHGAFMLSHVSPTFPPVFYWVLFWIIAFSYLIGRVRLLPQSIGRLLKVIGSYYFAVFQLSLVLFPFADIAGWILGRLHYDPSVFVPAVGYVMLSLLSVLMLWGSWNAWNPIVRTYHMNIDKNAGSMKELHIAVASDIHLGNVVGKRHLRKLISSIHEMKPDLILLPGDVIDDDIEPFVRNQMSTLLAKLTAEYGVYAVLGNHEYYGRQIEEYIQLMKEAGIRVLRDETVLIHDAFYVAGRKDKTAESFEKGRRQSVVDLLSELDLARPVILMDHQPHQFAKAAEAGADLMLSGHTHRGQLYPNHWITRRIFELDWGYLLKNKMHVVVSSGFGTWGPPIRLGSRSEIIEIKIKFVG